MNEPTPPGGEQPAETPRALPLAATGTAPQVDPDAPYGRCGNPNCAARWRTVDGRPRPLEKPKTKPRTYCSGDCGQEARSRPLPEVPGAPVDGASWVRRLNENATTRIQLAERMLAEAAADRELYGRLRDELLARITQLESTTAAALERTEQAERRAANAELARDVARQQASDAHDLQQAAERRTDNAVTEMETIRRHAAEEVGRAEGRANQAEGRAEAAETSRKRAEDALHKLREQVQAEREQVAIERQQTADALDQLRQRLELSEQELAAERDAAAGLRSELTAAAAHVQAVDARLEELRAELVRRQADHERERNRLTDERDQAGQELAAQRATCDALRAQLAETTTTARVAEARAEGLHERLADLQARLAAADVTLPEITELDDGVLGVALPNGDGVVLRGEHISLNLGTGHRDLDADTVSAVVGALVAVAAHRARHR
ncbi:hypothetical protein [Nonomuraea sp. NPDC005692]|uniref:hypothetical protein n=1 Tax=Nonomuraea sp. NPDC005692 TaxID=3157168 RepID=UPI0033C564CB